MATKKNAIVPWTEKFAPYAKAAAEQVKSVGGGVGVKFGRGSITIGGLTVPGGALECVVIGYCALNAWYKSDYDPNDAQPPDCYAFAEVIGDEEMAPHENAPDKQCETCAACELNVFGSAKTGRGKACGNNARLGLVTAKDVEDADGIASAELATAKVSPTNVKNWAGYVKMLADEYGRPPWAVVTEVSSHDDPKTQIKLEFKLVSLIEDDDILTALEKRAGKIQDVLQVPYPAPTEKPVKKVVKKVVAGKSAKFAPKKPVKR
jgi:hypothetical protein